MITDEIRTHLLADSALASTLGNRITALQLPQETDFPAVYFLLVSSYMPETQDATDSNLEISRVRLHVFSETYGQIKTLVNDIRIRMQSLSSSIQNVSAVRYLGQSDAELETDLDVKHRIVDFEVAFN